MGFGDAPAPTALRPTFDDVAMAIDAFIAERAPAPVILYLHDFGGPIGMRFATAHPERIAGLIFQNFTITVEGWNPDRLKVYERIGGPETPALLEETKQFATVERSRFLHQTGARRPDALNPDSWAMDAYACSIATSRVFMSRLMMNLSTNIQRYPEWTAYLKEQQPKTLIVWGRHDPLMRPAAAEFVKQVVPAADLRYFDSSHFALDENAEAIAEAIVQTFAGDDHPRRVRCPEKLIDAKHRHPPMWTLRPASRARCPQLAVAEADGPDAPNARSKTTSLDSLAKTSSGVNTDSTDPRQVTA